ncbi:MAG: matrixin family metalloprotease [Polyangiaceae bacterium]
MTLLGVAMSFATASSARAFCRSTTVPAPPGYDPSASGCWTEGRPLAWLWNEHISYSLASAASREVDLADATRIADLAFDSWNHAPCAGGPPNVVAVDDGPIDPTTVAAECRSVPCDPGAPGPVHLIVFRDGDWMAQDPTDTLALTTVTYATDSGIVFGAEIEINSHDHRLTTAEPPPPGTIDLRTILTHEAGHFLGLAHATDVRSVMYAYYNPDSFKLTADDIAGICAIYPPDPAIASCSITADRKSSPASALIGIVLFGITSVVRRKIRGVTPR